MSGLMQGKCGIVMGLANDKSIAWGIAEQLWKQGAQIALTYQGHSILKRVAPLARKLDVTVLESCDVTDQNSIDAAFDVVEQNMGKIDFLVHAIGFSDKNQLRGKYLQTTRDNFLMTMDVSCFSFTAVCKRAYSMMNPGSSALTLTYLGADKCVPNYNVMGVAKAALESSVRYLAADMGDRDIRVNALSAGPIRTLAASGIGDFRTMLQYNALSGALERNMTTNDVGKSAVYLLSDLSSGVSGQTLFVDGGNNIMAMPKLKNSKALADIFQNMTAKTPPQ